MNLSVIEIGTNSTKMITVEPLESNEYRVLDKSSIVNRLSSKMYFTNVISNEAMERGLGIIGDYIKDIERQDSQLISIFSTSVLRDAENRNTFIKRVKDLYGYDINVISGEKEAFLAYKACSGHAGDDKEKFAVIDIGGGSTEIILGTKSRIDKKISLDIGAVRLMEMFVKSDPMNSKELENIREYIMNQIRERRMFNLNEVRLIGTGGTIKTIATIYKELDYRNEKDINGLRITTNIVGQILEDLVIRNIDERKKTTGLNPKRADVILSGLIILYTILSVNQIDELTVSSQGVLEGFIEEYFDKRNPEYVSI